jgi:hypothetical protein
LRRLRRSPRPDTNRKGKRSSKGRERSAVLGEAAESALDNVGSPVESTSTANIDQRPAPAASSRSAACTKASTTSGVPPATSTASPPCHAIIVADPKSLTMVMQARSDDDDHKYPVNTVVLAIVLQVVKKAEERDPPVLGASTLNWTGRGEWSSMTAEAPTVDVSQLSFSMNPSTLS